MCRQIYQSHGSVMGKHKISCIFFSERTISHYRTIWTFQFRVPYMVPKDLSIHQPWGFKDGTPDGRCWYILYHVFSTFMGEHLILYVWLVNWSDWNIGEDEASNCLRWLCTDCTMVNHHFSPPFGEICFTFPSIEHANPSWWINQSESVGFSLKFWFR